MIGLREREVLALDMNSTASCTCLLMVRCRHEVDGGDWIRNLPSSKKKRTNRSIDMMTSYQEGEFQGKGRRMCWDVSDQP